MSLTVEKCLQAWTNSLRQMNTKADIVFFGDSLIYYGNFSSVLPNKVVCNLGLRGDTIHGAIARVEQVSLLDPKVVYLMVGINDVAKNTDEKFRIEYEELVQQMKTSLPTSKLFVYSILPVNDLLFSISCNNGQICNCNSHIEKIAREYNIPYLDLYSIYEENGIMPKSLTLDGIHLTNDGYGKWYNVLIGSYNL